MGDVARTYWTDERIDSAFGELRQELREFRGEMVAEMRALRTELHGDMAALRDDFHDLRKQALTAAVAIIVALIGVIGAVLVSQ